ncbi:MAG: LysR family transcriptional regulator [Butyrivibrio sp.]|nr:LysR family transcriptional regulator [Butyrivibrio sp.]
MLDFRIETFLTVCKYMNYTHAAQALHITQPAVSQHIKYLENTYSAKLFIQDGKKLILTPSGKILYEKMNLLKNDEIKLKNSLSQGSLLTKDISFGVTMTIGEYVIADPISRFLKLHPDKNIKIHFGNTKELLESLENGDYDFALVEGYFPEDKYDYSTYKTVDFIPVCSASHYFSKKPLLLKDLFNERIIIREPGSGTRNILEKNLSLQNYDINNFKNYILVENMHTVIQLLNLDCGISFLYKEAVTKDLESGKLAEIKLKDFIMKHDFTFIWQKDSIFSEEIRKICTDIFTLS